MTSPALPSPTFKTSGRTNDMVRSLRLRLQAKLNRELTYDAVIGACVEFAEQDEDGVVELMAARGR